MASISEFLGYIKVETPKYRPLPPRSAEGAQIYELRRYEPTIRAEVTLEDEHASRSTAFRVLAGYIFGKNTKHQSGEGKPSSEIIAMTAPVLVDEIPPETDQRSEQIAMSAPVMDASSKDKGSMTMSFILPSKYKSVDNLPVPKDPRVKLVPIPSYTAAVIRFSGSVSSIDDDWAKAKEKELREALRKDQVVIKAGSLPSLAQYNPPWTPSWWRTNEIQISVDIPEIEGGH